jgi:hypothetical protein
LQDHRLLILPQKLLRKDTKDRHWQEQIPSRREINPAKIARTGVTVARLENHSFPLRIFRPDIGQHKVSLVKVGSPRMLLTEGFLRALFELGVCGLIRNPFGIGSNFFSFSWMLCRLRQYHD